MTTSFLAYLLSAAAFVVGMMALAFRLHEVAGMMGALSLWHMLSAIYFGGRER